MSAAAGQPKIQVSQKNVTAASTAEKLPNMSIPVEHILVIKAKNANTGLIELGGTKSEAEGALTFTLKANESVTLNVINANVVWIDATVNGEGVELIAEKAR